MNDTSQYLESSDLAASAQVEPGDQEVRPSRAQDREVTDQPGQPDQTELVGADDPGDLPPSEETGDDEPDLASSDVTRGDEGWVDDDDLGHGTTPRKGPSAARTEALEREGEVAADFLERLLDIADLDGDIDVDVEGDRAAVAIVDSEDGRVSRRLVGPDGRVLEALQELTRMAVQAATGERSRLMLDVAGHRAERRRIIVAQARTAIDEVTESGQAHSLNPMTAFERKIVHDEALAAGLVSESEGTDPLRYVVIQPE